MDVEVVDEKTPIDSVCAGENADELVAYLLHPVREVCVQLDAIARGQCCVLLDAGTPLRPETECADALAELDGSGAVAEPEADEAVHDRGTLYCGPAREIP